MNNGTVPDFHVAVICSGNICRSPIGEQVLRAAFADAGLSDRVTVSSAGTGGWHIGQGADERAVRVLAAAGLPTDHRVRQITAGDLDSIDLVLAADRAHLRELRRLTDDHTDHDKHHDKHHDDKIVLLRSFDADAGPDAEVPDPYYGPDAEFDQVLAMMQAAAPGVVAAVRERLSV